jgi:hypothetical protein
MRVVAILTLNVLGDTTQGEILHRIVQAGIVLNEMSIWLYEFRVNIGGRHIGVVAHEAVILFKDVVQKPRMPGRRVRSVAVFAPILGHRLKIGMRPWVCPSAVPLGWRYGVRT